MLIEILHRPKSPARERQHPLNESEKFSVVDDLGLPGRIRIVMKPVRVFDEFAEFLGILLVKNLLSCPKSLLAKSAKGAEKSARRKMLRACHPEERLDQRPNRSRNLAIIIVAPYCVPAEHRVPTIMLRDAVLVNVPRNKC